MEKEHEKSKLKFGLIGRNIDYSFSRSYFSEKFETLHLPYSYVNFDIADIRLFSDIINEDDKISGLNVTIPYKEQVIPYLDSLDKTAQEIGAVNTIKIYPTGKTEGFNTDFYGFQKSIEPYISASHKKALILGSGGASKAIAYALKQLNITFDYVSRKQSDGVEFQYSDLTENKINEHQIIINCTPVGTFPNVDACPDIPYDALNKNHLLFDLIYNPTETTFLKKGREQGALTCNGSKMLVYQAEKAWEIWGK